MTRREGEHTPGPWQVVVSRGQSAAYTRVGAGDYGAVAECDRMRPSQQENAANARLIAAAPDLLAALQDAQSVECVNMCVVLKGSTIKNPLIRHSERCERQRRAIEQATKGGA